MEHGVMIAVIINIETQKKHKCIRMDINQQKG